MDYRSDERFFTILMWVGYMQKITHFRYYCIILVAQIISMLSAIILFISGSILHEPFYQLISITMAVIDSIFLAFFISSTAPYLWVKTTVSEDYIESTRLFKKKSVHINNNRPVYCLKAFWNTKFETITVYIISNDVISIPNGVKLYREIIDPEKQAVICVNRCETTFVPDENWFFCLDESDNAMWF